LIARHFGFCYGVENAIEIAFRALEENAGRKIYLLSEMIHNPDVNRDLTSRGVEFLQDTHGKQLIAFDKLGQDDIVIIPAFGAPLELLEMLDQKGIETKKYNTTCPFVERVWKKSEQIGNSDHTIIIHGKYTHEETRSTFSRSARDSEGVVVVRDMDEAQRLASYILGERSQAQFDQEFREKYSKGFDIKKHFERVGVINQTTMLASETQQIADYLKSVMAQKYSNEPIEKHFADTRDTLCYATNENQDATYGLLDCDADLAIVAGGYNSSNTSHLVELLSRKFPTYFIESAGEIQDRYTIHHYNYPLKKRQTTVSFLPDKTPLRIIITGGASCPDSVLEGIITRINGFFPVRSQEDVLKHLQPH
jgi:4-hydroxy-3-methylbut-2-enyl diphosphate reductase